MSNIDIWTEFENHLLLKQLTKKRVNKLRVMFGIVTRQLKLEKATREDIEKFLTDLTKNKFKKLNGKPFSGSTKSDIKKFLKQYYKFKRGDNEFYPKEVSWIITKIGKDEKAEDKPVISQAEASNLSNAFNKLEYKMMTLILFDSGFRIEELLSVKKRNLTFEEFDDTGNKCFWISCNTSKTEERKIPIELFEEDLKTFMNTAYYHSLNNDDLLFDVNYYSYLKQLKKASKKLLGKEITAHALRHSSATLYADLLNGDMIQIANRYGWSYNSGQLKRYIRRSKSAHTKAAKQVFTNELLKLKEQVNKQQEQIDKLTKGFQVYKKLIKA